MSTLVQDYGIDQMAEDHFTRDGVFQHYEISRRLRLRYEQIGLIAPRTMDSETRYGRSEVRRAWATEGIRHRGARSWFTISLWTGMTSSFLCALVPSVLHAADAAEGAPITPQQYVGAALAALLALCLLGVALLGFIWLTGRQVRRLMRGPVTKTKYDSLWFLKPLRPQQRDFNDPSPPPREELR